MLAGRPAGTSPLLSLDPADDLGSPGTCHFFAIVEPVVPMIGIENVATELLDCLRQEIDARAGQSATAALLGAVEAANAWLFELNRSRSPERHLQFGATCLLARDDELFVAQVPPSQVLIAQEGEVYAFPGLDVWRWHQRAQADDAEGQPFGRFSSIEPDLYHTRIERGDLVVLCSTCLGRVIESEAQDVFADGDAEAATAHLCELARIYQVDDAHIAAIAVTGRRGTAERPEFSLLRRVGDLCTHLLPEETAERIRRRARRAKQEVDPGGKSVHTVEYLEDALDSDIDPEAEVETASGSVREAEFPRAPSWDSPIRTPGDEPLNEETFWRPEGRDSSGDVPLAGERGEGRGKLTELLAGAVLALSAAVVGVWQLTVHRDRPIGGPREDGTLGLPRLHRYEDSPQFPDFSGIRARLPRAPISRLTGIVAVLLVVVLAAALVYSVQNSRVRARQAQIENLLQTAVLQREDAAKQTDPAAALAYLQAASAGLAKAQALGLDQQRATQEATAISAARDQALQIDRLSNVQVLGSIPPAPQGVTPRIFFGNGQLYVLTDALYRLDSNGTTLVRLLGAGDQVGGAPVGTLLGASWGDGAPLAFDGNSAYLFDPTSAKWTRQPLGNFGSAYSGIVQAYGFGGNLYLLSPGSGQILKFRAGAYGSQPEDWTGGLAANDLRNATDMQIDGRIYVLLKDGHVLDFYMSALEKNVAAEVTPPIKDAVALSAQPDRPYVYVADSQDRILRLTRDGKLVQQFMSAPGAPPLSGIRDIAIDDVLGVGYVLTDRTLLSIRLPGPPR